MNAPPRTNVGQLLRAERERQGRSLSWAAEAIRLSEADVRALEAGDLEALGGGARADALLRLYATALDLDAEEVLRQRLPPSSTSRRAESRARQRQGQRPGGRRGLLGIVLAVLLLLGVTLVVRLAAEGTVLAADLRAAEQLLLEARQAGGEGDMPRAQEAFDGAGERLRSARARLDHPMLRAIARLPLAGDSLRALLAVTDAGVLVVRAGQKVTAGLADLPAGLGSLAPRAGRIPLAPLAAAAPGLREGHELLQRAANLLERPPPRYALPHVRSAHAKLYREVRSANPALRAAAVLAERLPAFLGGEGRRRYFFAAANPAELRGSGGFIGAYTILTVRDGRLRLEEFRPVQQLPTLPHNEIEPPNEDFAARYSPFSSAGFWLNINMSPDMPSVGQAILNLYETGRGERLDGVILADPFMLAALVGDGTVEVPGLGPVPGPALVHAIGVEARPALEPTGERKEVLGEVAKAVLEGYLRGESGEHPRVVGQRVIAAAAKGHLLLYARDPHVQAAFAAAGVDGSLGGSGTDYLAVVGNNASASKLDAFLESSVTYRMRLDESGGGLGEMSMHLRNTATPDLPDDIVGDTPAYLDSGDSFTFLSYFCDRDCEHLGSTRDAAPLDAQVEVELDHRVFSSWERVRPGTNRVVTHKFKQRKSWKRDEWGGRYVLVHRAQPTVRQTRLSVHVDVPSGTHVIATVPHAEVNGGQVRWEGDAADLRRLEIVFARSPETLWSRLVGLLRR